MPVDPTQPFVNHFDGSQFPAFLKVPVAVDNGGKGDGMGEAAVVVMPVGNPNGYLSAGGANQDSTVVKAAPAVVLSLSLQNTHATAMRYVKLYDKATGPTSADTPKHRYALAPAGGGITRQPLTLNFVNGLAFRITTGVADNDTGAASAGDVIVNLDTV